MGIPVPLPPLPPSGEYPKAWMLTRRQKARVAIFNLLVAIGLFGFVVMLYLFSAGLPLD